MQRICVCSSGLQALASERQQILRSRGQLAMVPPLALGHSLTQPRASKFRVQDHVNFEKDRHQVST